MNIVVGMNTDLSMCFFGIDLEHKRQEKFDHCSAAEDSEVRALALISVDIPSEVALEVDAWPGETEFEFLSEV
jgi:hypothetical protein